MLSDNKILRKIHILLILKKISTTKYKDSIYQVYLHSILLLIHQNTAVIKVAADSCSLVALLTGTECRFVLLAQVCVSLTTTESLCCTTIFAQCETRGCLDSWERECKSDCNDQLWLCCSGSFCKAARLKHTPRSHLAPVRLFKINRSDNVPL